MSDPQAGKTPATALDEFCAEHLLDEKWLLAPSLRIGQQWLESALRCTGRMANLHVVTPVALAVELAEPGLSARKLALAGPSIGWLLTHTLCRQLVQRRGSYFAQAATQPTFYQSLYASLCDLRMAAVEPSQIQAEQLETPNKADDLSWLLGAYAEQLAAHHLIDTAGVLRMAIDELSAPGGHQRRQHRLLLVPDLFSAAGLEQSFLRRLPAGAVHAVTIRHAAEAPRPNVQLLQWLPRVAEAPRPSDEQSVTIFRAVGECNEVREVLRRCLTSELPLDEVEILYSDAETYAPLLYQVARRLTDDASLPDGVPITFAEGIPAILSRPGRALECWLRWIDSGFPQPLLVGMLGDGLLNLPAGAGEQLNTTYLATLLRPVAIGGGATNYLVKLEEQIQALADSGEVPRSSEPEQREHRERRRSGLICLHRLTESLLALAQPLVQPVSASGMLDATARFLEQAARDSTELDHYAMQSLLEQLGELRTWLAQTGDVDAPLLLTWLYHLPRRVRVMGSGPRPGHVHAGSVHSGGHSGRRLTFVVGLDDTRFPAASRSDPIVLDGERTRLSGLLSTSGQRVEQQWQDAAKRWSRFPGRVCLSWSCRNLQEDRELFPSPALLAAFRLVSGHRDGDLTQLHQFAGSPVSFAPQSPTEALDETEQWLWWLSHPQPAANAGSLFAARYPCLSRGDVTRQRRFGDALCDDNGFIPEAAVNFASPDADGPIASATRLELAGRCPLAYFFAHRLHLTPLEELDPDLEQWLDPAQLGTLAHEVFRCFMSELAQIGELPNFEKHHVRLARILRSELDRWRKLVPPRNESAFRGQYWKMVRMTQAFLMAEEELCAASRPKFFEAALGLPAEGPGTAVDSPDPVLVDIGDGASLRVRGRLDRIDELPDSPSEFAVWDYKTGSGYGYDIGDPFRQGRVLQNVLYLLMAEAALRKQIDGKAKVKTFGYFFPAARTAWKRVVWSRTMLLEGRGVLVRLVRLLARGVFPATTANDDCTWCDFAAICHDVNAVTKHSQTLLDGELPELREFKELRGDR